MKAKNNHELCHRVQISFLFPQIKNGPTAVLCCIKGRVGDIFLGKFII